MDVTGNTLLFTMKGVVLPETLYVLVPCMLLANLYFYSMYGALKQLL